jgi:hypothetical protein
MTAAHHDDRPGLERAEVVSVALGRRLIAGKQRQLMLGHEILE